MKLNVKEAAVYLGITPYALVHSNLPFANIGSGTKKIARRYDVDDLKAWKTQREEAARAGLLTVEEATQLIGLSANSIRSAVHRGNLLAAARVGRRTLFSRADLTAYAESRALRLTKPAVLAAPAGPAPVLPALGLLTTLSAITTDLAEMHRKLDILLKIWS
jgi:excisionase family DNA binding protein